VQRIELGVIGLLLRKQTRDPRQRLGKVRRKAGTVGDLAANVAGDATEKFWVTAIAVRRHVAGDVYCAVYIGLSAISMFCSLCPTGWYVWGRDVGHE